MPIACPRTCLKRIFKHVFWATGVVRRPMACGLWPYGPMALWPHGPMARWPHGPMAPWPDGPQVLLGDDHIVGSPFDVSLSPRESRHDGGSPRLHSSIPPAGLAESWCDVDGSPRNGEAAMTAAAAGPGEAETWQDVCLDGVFSQCSFNPRGFKPFVYQAFVLHMDEAVSHGRMWSTLREATTTRRRWPMNSTQRRRLGLLRIRSMSLAQTRSITTVGAGAGRRQRSV